MNILYNHEIAINANISVQIPSIGTILENEKEYYELVTLFTATPYEMMVQMDDAGIDFTEISDFELFCLLVPQLKEKDISKILNITSLAPFQFARNTENGDTVLWDQENNIVLDKLTHYQIASALRKIHYLSKPKGKPGNDDAKKYMIERARMKQNRLKKKKYVSQLENLIIALVNTEQYKYNFETTLDLTIYQFNACVHQIMKKIQYHNTMIGCYAGTLDMKNVSPDDLNWLTHKKEDFYNL